MDFMRWDGSFSVDVHDLDAQHKVFIEIINRLFASLHAEEEHVVLARILRELQEYASFHFANEERYFVQFHYAEADMHVEEHRQFIARIADFRRRYIEGEAELGDALLETVKSWLTHHIQGTDKRYTQCFHEHGLR
jgi:hemerythrin